MGIGSRREFLKVSAGVAAGLSLDASRSRAESGEDQRKVVIPPHKPLPLAGLHAYAQKSIAAGEEIIFRVSSSVPYHMQVLRLAGEVDDPSSDIEIGSFRQDAPAVQPIHIGSYINIPSSLSSEEISNGLSVECWLRPWGFNRRQGIVTQNQGADKGFGLFLGADSRVHWDWTDDRGKIQSLKAAGHRMARRVWTHLVVTMSADQVQLYCDGELVASSLIEGGLEVGSTPLRIGATGGPEGAEGFLDGDIAMPIIYGRSLSEDEVTQRYRSQGLKLPAIDGTVLGCWKLNEEEGDSAGDVSDSQRTGTIINHGCWQIGGPSFRAESVHRYGQDYVPSKDGSRGHGLRLCSDDLVDCRWQETHRLPIPRDAKSGVYVGRFHYQWDGKPMQYDCTFIVRRAEGKSPAPILMICSTSTWLAYNCAPFPRPRPAGRDWNAPSLPEAPTYCCYHNHRAGQPTYYLGVNRPWPGAGADNLFSPKEVNYSHLMRGELFTHRWLDGVYDAAAQYAYDVVTDWDLHNNPEILNEYQVAIVNGHSEYWSAEAFTGLDRYLSKGGNLIVMSGNTFFWRTSYSDDGSVMECRKYDARIGGRRAAPMGETWHSQDANRGSLLRECGFPEYHFVGLACIGWDGLQKKEDYGIYHLVADDHFLFNEPEMIGLKNGDTFGHAVDGGLPHAVGHEWDVRLPTLAAVTTHIPIGGVLPDDEPAGIVTLAEGYRDAGGGTFDYFTNPARTRDGVSAEMIFWERPQGGQVLHFGAIAIGWALSADPKLSGIVRNAMHHFGVPSMVKSKA